MQTIDYIITANHYSEAEGAGGTVRGRILKRARELVQQNRIKGRIVDIDTVSGEPVTARIWQGTWIADCPDCRGAEFVSHHEPVFWCCGCANRRNDYRLRPVIFPEPEIRAEIERLILSRPVDDVAGIRDVDRACGAQPLILVEMGVKGKEILLPLRRDWEPHETIEDLQKQNDPIAKWLELKDEEKNGPVKIKAKKAGK